MKFGQLIEYTVRNIFVQGKEARRLVPDLFLFFKKALCEVKASGRKIVLDLRVRL